MFLKAIIEQSIVGSVHARCDAGTCYIGRLIVKPQLQCKGIGTALLRAIENRFSNVRRFELFTGHKSRDNLTFYAKRGYKEFKREAASAQVTLVYMEKILGKTENQAQS